MVYIDIYFLYNFAFDFLILQTVGKLTGRKRRLCRAAVGAAAGAAWSCVAFVLAEGGGLWRLLVTYFLCPLFMCRIAFGKKTGVTALLCFYAAACMGSGLLQLVHAKGGLRMLLVMAAAQLCLILTGRKRRREAEKETLLCDIELMFRGRTWKTAGIWDTGNRLCGIGREPVHLIDDKGAASLLSAGELRQLWEFRRFLGGEMAEDCYGKEQGEKAAENSCGEELTFWPLPYCGIGGGKGILPAFPAEQMIVHRGEQTFVLEKPWIGISETIFCQGKTYRVILNTMGLQASLVVLVVTIFRMGVRL